MLKRVAETISRYSMFDPGERVAVAVSGGADSVCLLHVLLELAPRWALRLSVAHLDHGLRGEESRGDADFVREMSASLGLPSFIEQTDVRRVCAEEGENLEQAARRARREFFRRLIQQGYAGRVALGHTRSDQAETVLFRFLRGSGMAGVAGILPVTPDGIVRPLLEVDRSEVRKFLEERGVAWRDDSSNRDLSLARNRIRHLLLPELARHWNPALPETLARMAVLAQGEEDYWRTEMDRLAAATLVRGQGAILMRATALDSVPRAVARRLVRRAVEEAKGNLRRVDFDHVEKVLALARKGRGGGSVRIAGLEVQRSFDWMRFTAGARTQPYCRTVPVPGAVPVPEAGIVLSIELFENKRGLDCADPSYNKGGELDGDRIPGALELRNWSAGDRYRPAGDADEESLKQLFQRARIPSWERRSWPMLTAGNVIVWARRFGAAADYAATADSRVVVRVRELEEPASSWNPRAGSWRL